MKTLQHQNASSIGGTSTRAEVYRHKLKADLFGHGKEAPTLIRGEFPVIFHPFGWDEEVTVKQYGRGTTFVQFCTGKKVGVKAGTRLQDRELRAAFEQVDRPYKLEQFLMLCGPFREPSSRHASTEQVIEWKEFLAWQAFMRDLQQQRPPTVDIDSPAAQNLKHQVEDMSILRLAPPARWSDGHPFFECVSKTALELIAATIAADIVNGAELRNCARAGCERLFAKESKHDERSNSFCSDRCRKLKHQDETRPAKRKVDHGKG